MYMAFFFFFLLSLFSIKSSGLLPELVFPPLTVDTRTRFYTSLRLAFEGLLVAILERTQFRILSRFWVASEIDCTAFQQSRPRLESGLVPTDLRCERRGATFQNPLPPSLPTSDTHLMICSRRSPRQAPFQMDTTQRRSTCHL